MTKEARIYNKGKTVSSISGAGKTGQLHANCVILINVILLSNKKNKLLIDIIYG